MQALLAGLVVQRRGRLILVALDSSVLVQVHQVADDRTAAIQA